MDYIADPFGFPMVWVHEAQAYVHCLPVTHVQLDVFQERGGKLRGKDVEDARRRPRTPIKHLDAHNYTSAFVTGIAPRDALDLARYYEDLTGERFWLPSHTEWHAAYRELAQRAFGEGHVDMLACCRDRAHDLAERLAGILGGDVQDGLRFQLKLADRMLFRLGVMEWVHLSGRARHDGRAFAGMGLPARHSWPILCDPELLAPVRPPTDVNPPFGFRLWRSPFREEAHA